MTTKARDRRNKVVGCVGLESGDTHIVSTILSAVVL